MAGAPLPCFGLRGSERPRTRSGEEGRLASGCQIYRKFYNAMNRHVSPNFLHLVWFTRALKDLATELQALPLFRHVMPLRLLNNYLMSQALFKSAGDTGKKSTKSQPCWSLPSVSTFTHDVFSSIKCFLESAAHYTHL